MSEPVLIAVITVGGMLGVAALTALSQFVVTRFVIRAEYRKVRDQVLNESAARQRERFLERLTEAVSELLAITDPQINQKIDYERVVRLIHGVQLLLNRELEHERQLNGALNELGLALQRFLAGEHDDVRVSLQARKELLAAHGKVLDFAQVVINDTKGSGLTSA